MTPPQDNLNACPMPKARPVFAWIIGAGFVVVAVVLFTLPSRMLIPIADPVEVDPGSLKVGPRRLAMSDPAQVVIEGAHENCNACHQIFESNPKADTAGTFHKDIRLNHGINNRCANCHDVTDHERLILRDGATVPFAMTPQLCAQCHGTVFRDWERGTHGKTLGSWITGSQSQHRLSCNQCHDPHSPQYGPYVPLPGPKTLRMGPQDASPHAAGKQSPLQRWLRMSQEHKPTREAHEEGLP